ncbi:cyclic nucleotide-binding domain-containing protein [Streptomyces sp. NPDC127114]|uniref:cyclic nucleotide-binding domain-containing protein n=1 Tax=Streptomyces sp. NPDC127114 TaxID=3345366 RepID=UPI0036328AE8
MSTMWMLLYELAPEPRDQLLQQARPVRFPANTLIFQEQQHADRFWIIEAGRVVLGRHAPGRSIAPVDTLVPGDLLGCSWMIPPHRWRFDATTTTEVHALEFDGQAVSELCAQDASVSEAVSATVAAAMARRLLT